ncbi:linear gramicidin synthetase subunit C domain protein [Mycobacterium xenopi 4042]|uniref:Linear gramicidin synthetase subunit C domain protein n=1 Tax=Mycobacterium xenopi 4042 TaxID=1299334 RepID=X8ANN5_MYCXE|nr:linear gramicidin synthetase subunit C domain protein [Mycobacterium xenopi 4042]
MLIALALAVAEFVGNGAVPVGIDVEGHGRHEELAPTSICRARSGGSRPNTRCRWQSVGCRGRR